MRISTKGRYGVRIMLELALHYDKDLLTVKYIAKQQDISEKYIEQIISMLNKAGLVRSQRGAAGGYRLASPPSSITVGEILQITEGDITIVECTNNGLGTCNRREECVTADVWREIREAVNQVIDNITLENLVSRFYDKCSNNYVI